MNPNEHDPAIESSLQPVLKAARGGKLGVLKLLKGNKETDWAADNGGTLLHRLFEGCNSGRRSAPYKVDRNDRKAVLGWLQEEEQKDIAEMLSQVINNTDTVGDTPLKLAHKQEWGDRIMLWLLGLGADISVLDPCAVEGLFDRCIEYKETAGEKNFRVRIKYGWQDKTETEQDMDWIKKLFDIRSTRKRPHVALMLK